MIQAAAVKVSFVASTKFASISNAKNVAGTSFRPKLRSCASRASARECGLRLAREILNGSNQSRRNIDTKSQISLLASGPAASLNG